MVNQGLSEDDFSHALQEGIELLADEHSSLVIPLATMREEEEAWLKRMSTRVRSGGKSSRRTSATKATPETSDTLGGPGTPAFLRLTASKSSEPERLSIDPTRLSEPGADSGSSGADEVDAGLGRLLGRDFTEDERKSVEAALKALNAKGRFFNSLKRMRRLNSLVRATGQSSTLNSLTFFTISVFEIQMDFLTLCS